MLVCFKVVLEGNHRSFLHNIPELIPHIGRVCENSRRCSRTGRPHAPWKPRVEKGKVTSFPTGEEREYSNGFCEAYAEGLQASLTEEQDCVFLEVFSGPNTPLSSAVAESIGSDPPPRVEVSDHLGVKVERSEAVRGKTTTRIDNPTGSDKPQNLGRVEENPYREAAVQAGKQPSYGKRHRLIADGLESPTKHLEKAKELEHPFDSLSVLKEDHRRVVEILGASPQEVTSERFKALDKKELESQQIKENRRASWTAKKLGLSPNTALMRRLQQMVRLEDQEVPELGLQGITITGEAKESNFLSQEEFHSQKMPRSREMMERVSFMAKKGSRT